ncbi:MAG: hypothetical protein ACRD2X_25115 [Vicinamibacteraceae bacterium]
MRRDRRRIPRVPRLSWWSSFVGTLLLGGVAVAWPLWQNWREYARSHPVDVFEVDGGRQALYANARWRMLRIAVEGRANETSATRRQARDTALVRARFVVTPGARTDLDELSRCQLQVRDAAGRRWEARGSRAGNLPNNCGSGSGPDFRPITAKVGKPWMFEVGFLVPRAVAHEVQPEVLLGSQLPRYLRFMR